MGQAQREGLCCPIGLPPAALPAPGCAGCWEAPPPALHPRTAPAPPCPPPHTLRGPTPGPAAGGARQTGSVLAPASSAPAVASRGHCNTRSSLCTCGLTPSSSAASALGSSRRRGWRAAVGAGRGSRPGSGTEREAGEGPLCLPHPPGSSHRAGERDGKTQVALRRSPATGFGPRAVWPRSPGVGEPGGGWHLPDHPPSLGSWRTRSEWDTGTRSAPPVQQNPLAHAPPGLKIACPDPWGAAGRPASSQARSSSPREGSSRGWGAGGSRGKAPPSSAVAAAPLSRATGGNGPRGILRTLPGQDPAGGKALTASFPDPWAQRAAGV